VNSTIASVQHKREDIVQQDTSGVINALALTAAEVLSLCHNATT
jgi:hypothetical protein